MKLFYLALRLDSLLANFRSGTVCIKSSSHSRHITMTTHSTGIETVHERGQGAYQFDTFYESLCALQSSVPLASVKTNLSRNVLEINADKIRSVQEMSAMYSISMIVYAS